MTFAPRKLAQFVFLWLSLATVLVPALGSIGSPMRVTEGSAFSAYTSDVSLGPSRPAPIERHQTSQSDGDGAGEPAVIAAAFRLDRAPAPRPSLVSYHRTIPLSVVPNDGPATPGARAPPLA